MKLKPLFLPLAGLRPRKETKHVTITLAIKQMYGLILVQP
jgi:hypothetical protein